MNILYLHTHDIGRCLSVYGAAVKTPCLEAFSQSGATVFREAFSVSPTCSPSRVGLLTGQYPHQQNMLGLAHRGHAMRYPERHLASWLGGEGYHTALAGVQHEFAPQAPLPYAEVIDGCWDNGIGGYDQSVADRAAHWLESRPAAADPFFLSVGFFWPHVPLPETEPMSFRPPIIKRLPDCEALGRDSAALATAVERVDAAAGTVLAALANSRHADDTMVIVTTDHGIPLPYHKGTLSDCGVGVALLLKIPGIKGPDITHAIVSQLDVFPTICEAIGKERPDWLEGQSLLPVLSGERQTLRQWVFAETNEHVEWEPARSVRTQRYKLIRHYEPRRKSVDNVDDSA